MARQRATTTAAIVAAAAQVFETKGYRNSTIDDICLEVGISRPTVYKYIESKPWLLDQMVALVTVELGEKLQELLTSPLSPREKIRAVIKLHIESATNKRVYYATVWSEQPELSEQSLQSFRAWSHTVTNEFVLLLDDFIKDEGLEPRADTTVLANLTLTMLTGLFRWYDPNGPTTPDDLANQVLALLSGPLPGIDQVGH
ncbi:TetR/AcrR family transcriptional regulator [Pseudonocardia alni]|uniref:TetR/AcrR family transcriptional regulator n=1 Tax=Pseudonocardia alni TaxID=33907 RepID=UPI00279CECCA|nr:TetR/AcrR family transcriptional regulator [Pseudonocardia alni]